MRDVKRPLLRVLAVIAGLAAAVVAWDLATYDARTWNADYVERRNDLACAADHNRLKTDPRFMKELRQLDREIVASIEGAHSRAQAWLATRRLEKKLPVAPYDPRVWAVDYRQLKADLAAGYANLDWMAQRRGLNLAGLDQRTTAALEAAGTQAQACRVIRGFVNAFHDPHLRLEAPRKPGRGTGSSTAAPAPAPDAKDIDHCASAGYEEDEHAFRFPFAELPGWTTVRGGDFPAGLVGETGVIRVAQLGETSYLSACRRVLKPGMGRGELKRNVRVLLQSRLTETLQELRNRGARRLLVDISGNGGGTEWVDQVAALMTDRPMSRLAARKVAPNCDRNAIWRGEAVCPVLAQTEERMQLQGTGVWTGPVLLLADRDTGSASEALVVWLQQNKIAKVIGERTAGAGCGYISGPTRSRFRAAQVDVLMPNCARFLDDGTNEIEGLAPDIEIPMHLEDRNQQATALLAALERA
jgi:hypothetical protein